MSDDEGNRLTRPISFQARPLPLPLELQDCIFATLVTDINSHSAVNGNPPVGSGSTTICVLLGNGRVALNWEVTPQVIQTLKSLLLVSKEMQQYVLGPGLGFSWHNLVLEDTRLLSCIGTLNTSIRTQNYNSSSGCC